jgi:hypothetical protein
LEVAFDRRGNSAAGPAGRRALRVFFKACRRALDAIRIILFVCYLFDPNKKAQQQRRSPSEMQKRAAIYVRVSTDKQNVENQLPELHQIAERRGWEVVEEYHDAGFAAPRAAKTVLDSIGCSRTRSGGDLTL